LAEPAADGGPLLINRVNGRVLELRPSAARLVSACFESDVDVDTLQELAPELFERLAYFPNAREVGSPLQRELAEVAV
jgi:hypothetical protein